MNTPLANALRYNRWAILTLIDACGGLTDAQLDATPPGVSGSLRALFVHVVGGQQTFALRTQGRQHEGELNRASAWPGWDTLRAIALESADALIDAAEALDADADVELPYLGKTYRFPRSFFLVHALEHGVEHRTEIKVALHQLCVDTPDLDAWSWAPEMGYGAEVPSNGD